MQINQATLAALFKGYRVQFLEAYQAGQPMWPQVAMKTTSGSAEEIYHWLGAVPGMRKLAGEVDFANLSAYKFAIANEEWHDTVAVKQADIERDSYGIYNPMFQSLGLAAAQHPDELVASLLVNGFTAHDYLGSAFFGTNKAYTDSKVKFTNKGTAKLSANSFATARTNIKSRVNSQGRR
ncbi:MAG: Mu-like prophage major head subunit gpT family protein [Chthoniobacteraceae bacterium]